MTIATATFTVGGLQTIVQQTKSIGQGSVYLVRFVRKSAPTSHGYAGWLGLFCRYTTANNYSANILVGGVPVWDEGVFFRWDVYSSITSAVLTYRFAPQPAGFGSWELNYP